jgi:uncharacterized membrane protein YbhN (UPF0104 family)
MKNYIKMLVSLVLIGLLIYNVEWESFLDHFQSLSVWVIAIVFVIYTVQFPISAMKWKTALEIHQLDFNFAYLHKIICIGFFFNNFLPTAIGGDAYRVIKTMPKEGFKSRAVSAVLLERIVGFAALLFLGFIGGVLMLLDEPNQLVLYYVLICVAGGLVAMCLLILLRLGIFSVLLERIKNVKKLEVLTHNLGHIWRTPGLLINIIFASLLFQVLAIIAISVMFDALGSDGGYARYALMAAVVGLASVLPISINGIGVIEGAFVFSATQLGIGYNEALIAAFMLRIMVVPLSLICGLIYFWDSHQKKDETSVVP